MLTPEERDELIPTGGGGCSDPCGCYWEDVNALCPLCEEPCLYEEYEDGDQEFTSPEICAYSPHDECECKLCGWNPCTGYC